MINLYQPDFEHDSCGVGMIAELSGTISHSTIDDALTILEKLEHRGASGADPQSGDGAGILIQIPDDFFRGVVGEALPSRGQYGVAFWMVPKAVDYESIRDQIETVYRDVGLRTLHVRAVPVVNNLLGAASRASEPQFFQEIVVRADDNSSAPLESLCFAARKIIEHQIDIYASSFSSTVLIYKGMLTSGQLRKYFLDLQDSRLTTALAIVHSRFSTNVLPRWELAQPFRYIAHNGEINTVRGNRNWMTARENSLHSENLVVPAEQLLPIVTPDMSDSASFDEVVELLVQSGRSLPHAILMMIPEAWERSPAMDEQRRDFYRYHAGIMEPWDGPASVTFTDGVVAGAVLDRNGLRPARYWVLDTQRVIFASEVGVLDVPPERIVKKGRLQPGRMFLLDMAEQRIVEDDELKSRLASQAPYGEWLREHQISLDEIAVPQILHPSHASVVTRLKRFGYTREDVLSIIEAMAVNGEEPIGSMGLDIPLNVFTKKRKSFFNYFNQLFAQVTNPPLDAIREELVTSTRVTIGGEEDLLQETGDHCRQIVLPSPVLSIEELAKIRFVNEDRPELGFRAEVFDGVFELNGPGQPGERLAEAIELICERVVLSVRNGANIIILSDRENSETRVAIPSLLLTSAVHQRLVREHLRTNAALIVESADVREVHHVACVLSFGASAVCPYLAYELIDDLVAQREAEGFGGYEGRYQYGKALNKGLVKVMSKMGVSTVASYIGSQLFESIGLSSEFLNDYFPGQRSRIEGDGINEVADALVAQSMSSGADGTASLNTLEDVGEYRWRRDGEIHLFNPSTVYKLQHSTRTGQYDIFKQYTKEVDEQTGARVTIRSLFALKTRGPISIDEVESVESLVKRFSTGAMSYGSISQEAHSTLAVAMNNIGGKSNTGEGGEDIDRLFPQLGEPNRRSAIKQVASGRFGVTSQYLVNADDIQIKMAQGAKPGEGGQLPGSKVYPWVARTRHSTPGVGLISPPPHHDIYSIEDLAQLIFDLKSANDAARIHVKLVSEQGIGTIAAGVAKAHADVILISGNDGGTGAAPLTSLKHAGGPWELGLAEAHQTLAINGLRNRVTLQVDGQIKTGRDVIIAAILGAEEFGFATAPLVVSGCVMMRVCHLDTCPVGIATQNPVLRERFTGKPEFVENFFRFVAEEVREYLAQMGARTISEMVGETSFLEVDYENAASTNLDLNPLLFETTPEQRVRTRNQDHGLESSLDHHFEERVLRAVRDNEPIRLSLGTTNVQRSTATHTGSAITRYLRQDVLPHDFVQLDLCGSAGQSLGAFIPQGVTIRLTGDANDYVGKGLSGGRIVISPPEASTFESELNIIAGNVLGYGATSGQILVRGVVGERLAVRNSGATIVVEGAGDHACEYMTGGTVVILGAVGRNMAAGMSGGSIFLYDPAGQVHNHLSAGVYEIEPVDFESEATLRSTIEVFANETRSSLASGLLESWRIERMNFVRIETTEYQLAREALRNG